MIAAQEGETKKYIFQETCHKTFKSVSATNYVRNFKNYICIYIHVYTYILFISLSVVLPSFAANPDSSTGMKSCYPR